MTDHCSRTCNAWALALICFSYVHAGVADTLHDIGGGQHQHHDSGWIFPHAVAGFTLVGNPQDVDGTVDVIAWYERVVSGVRTSAAIEIYPPNTAASDATFEDTKAALERTGRGGTISAEPFAIGGEQRLVGVKVSRTAGEDIPQADLYFVDTGPWIVRMRVTLPRGAESADNFVRQQRWESLGLSDRT